MKGEIKHEGIVDSVDDNHVRVRIIQTSACAQCKVSGHCSASESKVKMVDVYAADANKYVKDERVVVTASGHSGLIAVMLSAVAPLFIVIVVLTVMLTLTGEEATAALCGLASLIPYYIILYLLRHKIGNRISFSIEKG